MTYRKRLALSMPLVAFVSVLFAGNTELDNGYFPIVTLIIVLAFVASLLLLRKES